MLGPMVHFNIGGEKIKASYSLELSYWNYEHFPYSVDFGLEFEKKKIRLYSEAQTGIAVTGIAFGPIIEYQTENKKFKLGTQGSLWVNYFAGANLRFRKIDGTLYFSPGTYFKLPLVKGGNSSSSHHHFDFDP